MSYKETERDASVLALALLPLDFNSKQETSSKLCNDAKTFTTFPNLPTEIRLKIWRYAFPGARNVNLDWNIGRSFKRMGTCICSMSDMIRTICIETNYSLPSSLYANQESRAEILRHYFVICRTTCQFDYNNDKQFLRPLYLNPDLDIPFFTLTGLMEHDMNNRLGHSRGRGTAEYEVYHRIKEIEVRDWAWSDDFRLNGIRKDGKTSYHSIAKILQALRHLPSLQLLRIVLVKDHGRDDIKHSHLGTMDGKKEIVRVVGAILKSLECWKGVPRVTVEPWNLIRG